jgi:hypothetical protein
VGHGQNTRKAKGAKAPTPRPSRIIFHIFSQARLLKVGFSKLDALSWKCVVLFRLIVIVHRVLSRHQDLQSTHRHA